MTYRGDHNSNSFNRNFCSFVQFTICNNFSNLNLNQNVFELQGFQIRGGGCNSFPDSANELSRNPDKTVTPPPLNSRLFVSANQKALFENLPEHYLIRRTR